MILIGKLIPVRAEVVVGDEDWGVTGMIDQLFYNEKSQKLEIWDWKTNKDIKKLINGNNLKNHYHI